MTTEPGPDATSADYDAMCPYWDLIDAILGGAAAMKAAGEKYLPKFPNETDEDYKYRRQNAKFTNIFAEIVGDLAAKPFAEKAGLEEKGASPELLALAEDIDGRGNNMHVFASDTFHRGVAYSLDWILVDFTRVQRMLPARPLSVAEERELGLRPYWVHIPAKRMLAVYSDVVGGTEVFTHARFREDVVVREGFKEVTKQRVRVLNREPIFDGLGRIASYTPATFELWEKQKNERGEERWVSLETGPISIGVIALAPFATGRREGGSWRFRPALRGAADLQVEHYQQETALKSIKELTAFPMLAGNGVTPDTDPEGNPKPVPVGPRAVLYAPAFGGENTGHGEWSFIEPSAESLTFLAKEVETTAQQIRELGRQPLSAQSGITVVAAAFASQKATSAVQAWAWGLKDALEQAWRYTCMWLGDRTSKPVVRLFTDFDLDINDEKGPDTLVSMRTSGPNGAPDISRETLWAETRRRNILSGDFDPELEKKRLDDEAVDIDTEDDERTALGDPPANAA